MLPTFQSLPEYPGYRVGSDGSVWSCKTRKGAPKGTWIIGETWKQLTPVPVGKGKYRTVSVTMPDGKRKNVKVHLLVLTAFRGPRPAGLQGCHENGDTANNTLQNLRWGTPASNFADRDRHNKTARGEKINTAKLTVSLVLDIRREFTEGATIASLARRHKVSPRAISQIAKRRHWKHAG